MKKQAVTDQSYNGLMLSTKGSPKSEIYNSFDAIKKTQKSPLMKRISKNKKVA